MHHLTPYPSYLRACRAGLRLEVQLGSPRTHDCSSVGICQLHPSGTLLRGACTQVVTAYLRVDVPTGRLLLHVLSEGLDPEVRRRHFPQTGFTVREAYTLPEWVREALGLAPGRYRIAPGRYPTLEDGTFHTLSLRLTQREAVCRPLLLSCAA